MIGYYIHHHGSGHLHRAVAINQAMHSEATGLQLTGLSTKPRPLHWHGDWLQLPDDAGALSGEDWSGGGRLHYVPDHHPGLRQRMALIAGWIDQARPTALVVDVSVEVALLARLHGVPVISMAQPGLRTDSAHRLGYDVSRSIIAPWPATAHSMWPGVTPPDLAKTEYVGAISRFPVLEPANQVDNRVVVLNGTGGGGATAAGVKAAQLATPDWEWIHLDRSRGTWLDDPWPTICSAAVVVSHTGQNAVAEIAAARKPAILIPQDRPFDEQKTTATALRNLEWVPALVRDAWPEPADWPGLLDTARRQDGSRWSGWNDGGGTKRVVAFLSDLESLEPQSVSA